jgi:hypothetical protein
MNLALEYITKSELILLKTNLTNNWQSENSLVSTNCLTSGLTALSKIASETVTSLKTTGKGIISAIGKGLSKKGADDAKKQAAEAKKQAAEEKKQKVEAKRRAAEANKFFVKTYKPLSDFVVEKLDTSRVFSSGEQIQFYTMLPKYIENETKTNESLIETIDFLALEYENGAIPLLQNIVSRQELTLEAASVPVPEDDNMEVEGGSKSKTYKQKSTHIKKQTYPQKLQKSKRRNTIKHKYNNKKKYTKNNK